MPHKLLLADDSVTIQRVIELTFADEDVQVHAVGDGQKAISAVEAEHPDIVLADVGMPERDGYEVAAFIKGNPQLAHIPVLLLTGAFEPIDEARARAVGCDGVLVKPFEPQMVINRVKDLLAGRRAPGGWTQPPAAAVAPARPAASPNADLGVPRETPAAPSGSLEDYFDRLDAAFASLEGGAPGEATPITPQPGAASSAIAPVSTPVDDLGGWDPDLSGDSLKGVAPVPPPLEVAPSQVPTAPPPAPRIAAPSQPAAPYTPAPEPMPQPVAAAAVLPTLAEAFAALLSAEQARQIAPSTIGGRERAEVDEEVIEEVVRRVIARMGGTVLEAAERLVREEIDRIKQG